MLFYACVLMEPFLFLFIFTCVSNLNILDLHGDVGKCFFFNFFCPYTEYNKYSLILSCLNPVGFHLCQSTVKPLVASAERV